MELHPCQNPCTREHAHNFHCTHSDNKKKQLCVTRHALCKQNFRVPFCWPRVQPRRESADFEGRAHKSVEEKGSFSRGICAAAQFFPFVSCTCVYVCTERWRTREMRTTRHRTTAHTLRDDVPFVLALAHGWGADTRQRRHIHTHTQRTLIRTHADWIKMY